MLLHDINLFPIDYRPLADLAPIERSVLVAPGLADRQPCQDLPDPLEVRSDLPYLDAYRHLEILDPRALRLRRGVGDRLQEARLSLPDGFDLLILDGWRSTDEQQVLVEHYDPVAAERGFVARTGTTQRAPHTTGAAVDLTLSFSGRGLALGTDYDDFTDRAALVDFEPTDGEPVSSVGLLRRLLAHVLGSQGFVGLASEWWHWSFGDDVWANARGGPSLFDVHLT